MSISELEHALDNSLLWTYDAGIGEYIPCVRTGKTRPTKLGFTIPAIPGNMNHRVLAAINSGRRQDGNLSFVISPVWPQVTPRS